MAATLVKGDMIANMASCDHMLICTYSTLRSATGELVMMNGLAYEVSQKFPTAPKALGSLVKESVGDCGFYHLMCKNKIGIFQIGIVPRNGPSLGVISKATHELVELASSNPGKTYYLEAMWDVNNPQFMFDGFMQMLPENVHVWTKDA